MINAKSGDPQGLIPVQFRGGDAEMSTAYNSGDEKSPRKHRPSSLRE